MDQGKSMVESTSNGHLPKRWKPNLEQRRILESIFATGTKNTRRERIAQITAVLQQYGRVEQRNVFYWFQNANNRNKLCISKRTPIYGTTKSSLFGPKKANEIFLKEEEESGRFQRNSPTDVSELATLQLFPLHPDKGGSS
ncbi:WUSCHEL-related homeobox 8-like [Cryptomeria japonica]|uniref:WUSCHEL-related homeobox 8-like n=1 Tax=Cryptomeria japonica TaxID=3369 RepID=UPI0027DA26AE|nr:WUSCHEL-related homeobox 8-like [Cryptomeria japonica]